MKGDFIMKNTNLKLNKTKLVAKLMLVVVWVISAVSLFACNGGYGSRVDRSVLLDTNNDFVKFIERYNSKNDGVVYTFIAFDFDSYAKVKLYKYELNTMWKAGYDLNKMYDKNHSDGFRCNAIFHIDEINAQIQCKYSTKNYNFYQNDNISFEFIESYQAFAPDGVREEYADLRTFNFETLDYDRYYEYMYVYKISINQKEEVTVKITLENEITREKLDEIVQLLVDNITIINTED